MTAKVRSLPASPADPDAIILGRPVDSDALVVPERVELQHLEPPPLVWGFTDEREFLVWSSPPLDEPASAKTEDFSNRVGRSQGAVRLIAAEGRMLDEFLLLADAPGTRVLAYARKWGVLGICKHGKPCSHRPFRSERQVSPVKDEICYPVPWCAGGAEPIEAWRHYARLANTILQVGGKLCSGGRPPQADLRVLLAPRATPNAIPVSHFWPLLTSAVNRWIIDGDVRPQMFLRYGRHKYVPMMRLATPWWLRSPSWPLFGQLGLMIAAAVTGRSYWVCDGCGAMHYRNRRPPSGREHFCSEACAARTRQQRHRGSLAQSTRAGSQRRNSPIR